MEFPLTLTSWKLAPALAAGCTVVIKPSEFTSPSAVMFARLFKEAGFPDGVVNVVTGLGAEAGEPLASHPLVAHIGFTGGEMAGQKIYEAAARGLILGYLDIAREEGAHCVLGAKARPDLGAGWFVEPTILTNVTNDMRIAQEEVFGPVLAVIPFKTEQDAIRIGNDVLYGLAAGVWTQSLHRAMLMSEKLRAGTVWINNYRATSFTTPFGGYKRSGVGRESGVDAIKEYLETKSVWIFTDLDVPNPFIRR